MALSKLAVYSARYLSFVWYRLVKVLGLKGTADPNSPQSLLAPAGAAPLRVDTGTSTAGVRTPPMTLPWLSNARVGGVVLLSLNGAGLAVVSRHPPTS